MNEGRLDLTYIRIDRQVSEVLTMKKKEGKGRERRMIEGFSGHSKKGDPISQPLFA